MTAALKKTLNKIKGFGNQLKPILTKKKEKEIKFLKRKKVCKKNERQKKEKNSRKIKKKERKNLREKKEKKAYLR